MAFSAVTERGSASEKISDTSIAMSPSANLAVDKIVMVLVGTDCAGSLSSGATTNHDTLADTDGHTWNKVYERTQTAGTLQDGPTHSLWWAKVISQIGTGDSITFTGDTAVTAKVIAAWEVTVGAGNSIQVASGGTTFLEVAATTNPAALTLSGLPSKEYLFIGVMTAEEEQITWAESATFTNIFAAEGISSGPAGTPASNITIFAAARIATDTGATFDVGAYPSADAALALIAFEEVTSGTAHTASQTDNEDLLDSVTQVAVYSPAPSDLVGLLDSVSYVLNAAGTFTDPLGLVDSVTQVTSSLRDQIDNLGLTDSVTAEISQDRTITDNLGMVDDGAWFAVGSDSLGLTDSITAVLTADITITDNLGLVDDATGLIATTATITDNLGLVDTTSQVADYALTIGDSLGLTDSLTASGANDITITDLLGLTDNVLVTDASFWSPDPASYTVNPAAYVPVEAGDTPPPW